MPRTRRDVWKLNPQPWPDDLLWYARAVGVLQDQPIASRRSWRFFGAIHGINPGLWEAIGYLEAGEPLPPPEDEELFWMQCQHQTWYFLPWHRGYLAAFEALVREAIAGLGGPRDWALPYWNYSDTDDPSALQLPGAFYERTLPGGGRNPLFVERRYGDGEGTVVIRPEDVGLNALKEPHFEGTTTGGSTGFGGVLSPFQHYGDRGANGRLERQPHNVVHSRVGGIIRGADSRDLRSYGLMSLPDTAALDPVFWLHHANIDRLWEVWLKRNSQNQNPAGASWLTGPVDRRFALPWPDGSTWSFAARDVLDTTSARLDYEYESTADPFGGADLLTLRLERLGAPADVVTMTTPEAPLAKPETELIGTSSPGIRVTGDPVEARVRVDQAAGERTMRPLRLEANDLFAAVAQPDRVFLNLENVQGINDAAVLYVYVSHPAVDIPERHVGAVGFFGVRKASSPDGEHGGNGINESLEITEWVDELRVRGVEDLDDLRVRLVPDTPVGPEDRISIGRISLYRQAS